LIEKLARVGRQGFDVAALAFGVNGVEGERRFAGAGESCDDGQAVAWDFDVDVFEVVLARSAHRNAVNCHCLKSCQSSHRRKISGAQKQVFYASQSRSTSKPVPMDFSATKANLCPSYAAGRRLILREPLIVQPTPS
jgi:hypothetical protein